jgi:LysR family nitrogen assimilation transcriptional regulator
MDIRQLRYFRRIVETGSVTRAAEVLHIAQPALSLMLKKMEKELGAELFVRHPRGLQLTSAGQLLFDGATEIIGKFNETLSRVRVISEIAHENITLGVNPGSLFLATAIAQHARDTLPNVKLDLVQELTPVLIEWIMADRLDMALAFGPRAGHGLTMEPLLTQSCYFISAPNVGHDGDKPITFAEAASYPLALVHVSEQGMDMPVRDTAARHNVKLKVAFEIQSIAAIAQLVADGAAYTILPYSDVMRMVERGELTVRKFIEPEIRFTLYLVKAASRRTTPSVATFEEFLRALIKEQAANFSPRQRAGCQRE